MRNLKEILTEAKNIMTEETFSEFSSLLRSKARKRIITETVEEIDDGAFLSNILIKIVI